MRRRARDVEFSVDAYTARLIAVSYTHLRYAGIFQRVDGDTLLDIKVACVTDRDIMPDCAPHICINDEYTLDPTSWPKKKYRNWRAEADFTPEEAASHIKDIKQKADGQQDVYKRQISDVPKVSQKALTLILNSQTVDRIFRCLSGSVAVSATELQAIPLPPVDNLKELEEIAAAVHKANTDKEMQEMIENIILKAYGLED